MTNNVTFRDAILNELGSEKIHEICSKSNYKKLFTKEKWNAIIRCIVEQQQQCNLATKDFAKHDNSHRQVS